MLLGAHLAGVAFANAPVAGVHALAYPLGGIHHVPHGLSNALMLRPVLSHNMPKRRASLMPSWRPLLDPALRRSAARRRRRASSSGWKSWCSPPGCRRAARPWHRPRHEAPMLAREAMKQERLLVNNPCPITEADARRLYEAAW
jgi:alcohol dehydrogenase class IV